ncbi:MAG: hypothetical protein ED859_04570 [Desulfuromonadales bacterium]|nr:MAG: hypothetical protein ED859_04570 [Desulfuromonadales bacterium]
MTANTADVIHGSPTAQSQLPSERGTRQRWRGVVAAVTVDILVWFVLWRVAIPGEEAQTVSMLVATLPWFLVAAAREYAGLPRKLPKADYFYLVTLMITLACVRGGAFALLTRCFALPSGLVIALLSLMGMVTAFWSMRGWATLSPVRHENPAAWWPRVAWAGVALFFVLRLLFLGHPELIPEEAYYWLYAKHLALGYLDHPPMVAWLIAGGTRIFGENEFGVRIGALLCWIVTAYYVWRLADEMFDRSTASVAVLLCSALPFFFGVGLTTAPDSFLVAAWCGALYYLRRATLYGEGNAWLAMGVAVGFGLLSKYSIVLIGGTAAIMVLVHAPARRWLVRPHLYIGALMAVALFAPVIYWNATHDWASFAFQGSRRFEMPSHFSVHDYLLDIVVLLTPVGLLGVLDFMSTRMRVRDGAGVPHRPGDRLFVAAGMFVPFAVFLLYSIKHKTKLNWSGPAYIVLLPCLASQLLVMRETMRSRLGRFVAIAWAPTLAILAVLYGVILLYFGIGIPGLGYSEYSRRFVGWKNLTAQVVTLADQKEKTTGERPLIVALDKHTIASELLFYSAAFNRSPGVPEEQITSRNIFGRDALMFNFWDRELKPAQRSFILVAQSENDLRDASVTPFFDQFGEITPLTPRRNGRDAGRYFYRFAQGYRPDVLRSGAK